MMILVVAIFLLTAVGVTIYFYVTRVFRKPNVPPAKVVGQDTLVTTQNHQRQQSVLLLLSDQKKLSHESLVEPRIES
jgi:hypothetical protein